MAHVTQSVGLSPSDVTPFAGRPASENNIYPRSRIVFKNSTQVSAKGAGDTKSLITNISLPQNFYYVIDSFFQTIGSSTSNDADNYELQGLLDYKFTDGSSSNLFTGMTGVIALEHQSGQWLNFSRSVPFCEVWGNQLGNVPVISTIYNDTDGVNASSALTLITYCSFLQYDVRQADKVTVNAPLPVSIR